MAVRDVLLLGNPKLYEIGEPIERKEVDNLPSIVQDLHDTLIDFKKRYGTGRAIAAPQIGMIKRMIYMYINEPKVFINPVPLRKVKKEWSFGMIACVFPIYW